MQSKMPKCILNFHDHRPQMPLILLAIRISSSFGLTNNFSVLVLIDFVHSV